MSTLPVSKIRRSNSKLVATKVRPRTFRDLGNPIVVPAAALTLAGFRKWAKSRVFPTRGQISFLDGDIYIDMSPEELENHSKVKAETGRVLLALNREQDKGEFYPDGTLVTNVEANLSTEPDATFVTWETLKSGRVRLVPRKGSVGEFMELEGTPDWIMEIISKYSVRKDTRTLREKYHRARTPEYRLINARRGKINFTILRWRKSGYEPANSRGDWQFSTVFGSWFRPTRRRWHLGLWKYTLEVKGATAAR